MRAVGDVHVYVSDFPLALRFWRDGLALRLVEQEVGSATGFALLAFPDGDTRLRLFLAGAHEEPAGTGRAGVGFDVITDAFDATLVRLLEHGGDQLGGIETYDGLRIVSIADPDGNRFELVEAPAGDD